MRNKYIAIGALLIILALICAGLCSCGTTQDLKRSRAEKYYRDHPKELAEKCTEMFPIRDSVGEPIYGVVVPGNNENYQASIDSIQFEAKKLNERLRQDTSLYGYAYREEIIRLQVRIKDLATRYKPCVPDTIPKVIPTYWEDTRRIAALRIDNASLQAELQDKAKESHGWQEKAQKRGKIIGWAGSGLVLLAIGGIAWKLRKLFI